jgi:hypothetical protein
MRKASVNMVPLGVVFLLGMGGIVENFEVFEVEE